MEIIHSHQGDGYRVILSFVTDHGCLSKCATMVDAQWNAGRSVEGRPVLSSP
jgi:hypothetical protein